MFKILNNNKPTIIAMVGNSGSGKTTIAQMLKSANVFPSIVSYTTRPMRDNEINGVDHYFVSENEMPSRDEMLAYTYFANNHYWASLSDIQNDKDQPIIYIIDECGLIDLYKLMCADKINLIWVQIERNDTSDIDEERKQRDIERTYYFNKLKEAGYGPHILIKNNSSIEAAVFKTGYDIIEHIKNSGKDIMDEDAYNLAKLLANADYILQRYKNN